MSANLSETHGWWNYAEPNEFARRRMRRGDGKRYERKIAARYYAWQDAQEPIIRMRKLVELKTCWLGRCLARVTYGNGYQGFTIQFREGDGYKRLKAPRFIADDGCGYYHVHYARGYSVYGGYPGSPHIWNRWCALQNDLRKQAEKAFDAKEDARFKKWRDDAIARMQERKRQRIACRCMGKKFWGTMAAASAVGRAA